jgi:hypothetical protein
MGEQDGVNHTKIIDRARSEIGASAHSFANSHLATHRQRLRYLLLRRHWSASASGDIMQSTRSARPAPAPLTSLAGSTTAHLLATQLARA